MGRFKNIKLLACVSTIKLSWNPCDDSIINVKCNLNLNRVNHIYCSGFGLLIELNGVWIEVEPIKLIRTEPNEW